MWVLGGPYWAWGGVGEESFWVSAQRALPGIDAYRDLDLSPPPDSRVLLGDFSAHVDNDRGTWWGDGEERLAQGTRGPRTL